MLLSRLFLAGCAAAAIASIPCLAGAQAGAPATAATTAADDEQVARLRKLGTLTTGQVIMVPGDRALVKTVVPMSNPALQTALDKIIISDALVMGGVVTLRRYLGSYARPNAAAGVTVVGDLLFVMYER
jgi:hypothetical protein